MKGQWIVKWFGIGILLTPVLAGSPTLAPNQSGWGKFILDVAGSLVVQAGIALSALLALLLLLEVLPNTLTRNLAIPLSQRALFCIFTLMALAALPLVRFLFHRAAGLFDYIDLIQTGVLLITFYGFADGFSRLLRKWGFRYISEPPAPPGQPSVFSPTAPPIRPAAYRTEQPLRSFPGKTAPDRAKGDQQHGSGEEAVQ